MAGEQILIVDDTPVNLKLTRILLVNEGFNVVTAASAEEALELLGTCHPQLILADIQLPGIDGLEMTRRIKLNEATRDITVVALTAFAMKGDEQKATEAGCEGYITKPIDTRTLGARIREYLARRPAATGGAAASGVAVAATTPPSAETISAVELNTLRRRFLAEGEARARQLLRDLDGRFNADDAARAVHQWMGTGGLLGYSALGRLAREAQALILEKPLDVAQVRESLTNLVTAFTSPAEARDAAVPSAIVQGLSGKCVAVVGLPTDVAQRLCVGLELAGARPVFFELESAPQVGALEGCDLVVIYVKPDLAPSPWLDPAAPIAGGRPIVLVGAWDNLLALRPAIRWLACDYLMDGWQPEEALVRLSLAIFHHAGAPLLKDDPADAGRRARILIADDDPTVRALVGSALQNFGMECQVAVDGRSALTAARRFLPHAMVLDVNMPGMDGYEVLAAIREEQLPVRVLLLTARQQESDIIRGFTLGADDYMVKPFNPTELVARLKRLLAR